MDATLEETVEGLLGAQVVAARPILGGYTANSNWVVTLSDGRSVFVKAATEERTIAWLRAEHRVYSTVEGGFLPNFIAWDEHDAVLVLEDLSQAHWPPPWPLGSIEAVIDALDALHAVEPPKGLPRPDEIDELRAGWRTVAGNPVSFLALGLCSEQWLVASLPDLLAASDRAELDGGSLLHLDVRSDNLCIRDGRCLLVDWSNAARGNPLLDLTLWLPSLHLEGGPPPDELGTPELAELAAVFAGYLAARAGRPEPPGAPPHGVRPLQLAQLRIALPWAARALGLPPSLPEPDPHQHSQ